MNEEAWSSMDDAGRQEVERRFGGLWPVNVLLEEVRRLTAEQEVLRRQVPSTTPSDPTPLRPEEELKRHTR